ncbi:MAG: hypothetical protein A2Y77_04555 [Planctomycetes bacterium RBG_13_62_9]|nr:MAG: hypothetical protein A2Y77_04555 [Planctomycetes bacterium RBG_13_62_9]
MGAVVCQVPVGPVQRGPATRWTFRGLDARVRPRIRPGSYASETHGVHFPDPEHLGPHSYRLNWSEKNGIVYTCRGGHIDIAHVRKAADWTGFLAAYVLDRLQRGETRLRFRLWEPSVYTVELTLPANWGLLSTAQREQIARDVSRGLGQYLAYTAMTWHEILTWFGYRPKGYKTEFPSAFSWEDTYSNLLGTCIAAAALQDQERAFDEAVTAILQQQLEELGVQPAHTARNVSRALRGQWYSRKGFLTTISKRSFDVGLDDGCVTPCLVPMLPACEVAQGRLLPVPTLDFLAAYGFSARLEIEPRVWEAGKILDVAYPNRSGRMRKLDPTVHFPRIMSHLEQSAGG